MEKGAEHICSSCLAASNTFEIMGTDPQRNLAFITLLSRLHIIFCFCAKPWHGRTPP
jgi:hypothetical protein